MAGQDISIQAKDGGSFSGYLSLPAAGSGPGIVVIQEIFGVNQVMRDICDWIAGEGYVALCPDLFWRQEPGIQITDQSEEEWKKAFELFGGFNVDKGVDDIAATVDALRARSETTAKVGAIGYCLGGRLAYLSSTRTSADAAVGYYGVMLADHLDETVNCPLILHIPTEDEFVPAEAQQQMHAALDNNANTTLFDYQGNDHAFARVGGAHYDKAAADLANQRSLDFLKTHLQ